MCVCVCVCGVCVVCVCVWVHGCVCVCVCDCVCVSVVSLHVCLYPCLCVRVDHPKFFDAVSKAAVISIDSKTLTLKQNQEVQLECVILSPNFISFT